MTTNTPQRQFPREFLVPARKAVLVLWFMMLASCAPFQPPKPETVNTYVLDARFDANPGAPGGSLTLVVSQPRAWPGFDTARMAYVRQAHTLDYFAKGQWADTPARMLAPLLVQALEHARGIRAVVQAPSAVAGDLRLDTEIVRLQQEFTTHPSRARFTLRAQLVDLANKRIVKTQVFDVIEQAPSDDPYGGVIAANRATKRVLAELVEFCATR